MDQEVAKTLGELEIKLQELERELTSIGRRDRQPRGPQAPGRLIDEAVEPERREPEPERGGPEPARHPGNDWNAEPDRAPKPDDERARAVDNAFGGPAVFGGEEVPAQGSTIERESAFPVSETAYGEIATGSPTLPAPPLPPLPQPIDRAELVRFRERLQRTMEDLIDEYSKLLLPKPPQ